MKADVLKNKMFFENNISNLRLLFTCNLSKLIRQILILVGRHGTAFPGRVGEIIYPDILEKISSGVNTVLITGTNGKTTTTAFVRELMNSEDVFSNDFGSNMKQGIVSSFLANTDVWGRPIRKTAVMECDEMSLPYIVQYIKKPVIAVLNVYQEQEERYGTKQEVMDHMIRGIRMSEAETICINADEKELCSYIMNKLPDQKFVTFSCSGEAAMVQVSRSEELVDVTAGNRRISTSFDVRGDFNLSNLAASIAAVTALGKCGNKELKRIGSLKPVPWHMQTIDYHSHRVNIYLVKNTECINRTLDLIEKNGSKVCMFFYKSIVDGFSSEWINAARFENHEKILENVICGGDFSQAVIDAFASRQLNIPKQMTEKELFHYIKNIDIDLDIFANCKAMDKLRKRLAKDK